MKILFFSILLLGITGGFAFGDAFADHAEVTIETAPGSGAPGCEDTAEGCYTPSTATVDVGGKVIFSNTDTAAHTFTSGDPTMPDTVQVLFDSGLAMAGSTFEWSPTEAGEVPYHCMVHPWMQGIIIVQEAGAEEHDAEGLLVTITDSKVLGGTQVELEFSKLHVNYDIIATQNGKTVLHETGRHSMELTATHQIDAVGYNDNPITVEIISLGIGAPGNEADWTGPKGTVATSSITSGVSSDPNTPYEGKEPQIIASSNAQTYTNGATVTISGNIKPFDSQSIGAVTYRVMSPTDDIMTIAQLIPRSDGSFKFNFMAGGVLWKTNGDYVITIKYGAAVSQITINYVGGEVIGEPEPTPKPKPTPDPYPVPEDDLDYEVTIETAQGSGAPGCEDTSQGCYIPGIASVAVGGKVIFSNTDTAAHTFTSGDPTMPDTVQVLFDSGLAMAGSTFEWSPTEEGVVDYFCMVHPWMQGIILVGEGTAPPPRPTPDTSIELQVSVNDDVYDIGDLVGVIVRIDGISGLQKVAIDVTGPNGSTVISRSLTFTSDNEDGEIEFRISEEFKTGTYKVTATTSDDGKTIRDTAYFKVKSQYNSFKITSVKVTDQQGNSSDLKAGEIGFIKVELESNKSITTLVTVNLFDSDLTSIGIGSVKTTLSSGNSEIILSFMIPADAATGQSNIYANAFSDWPSNGGIPLTGEVSSLEDIQ